MHLWIFLIPHSGWWGEKKLLNVEELLDGIGLFTTRPVMGAMF